MSDNSSQLINGYLTKELPNLIDFRRLLHSTPELSFKEFETTNKIFDFLAADGIISKRFEKTTGLYVDIVGKGAENKPKILIRGDIDALPIQDLKECDYKSQHQGVMHACGHDVHATTVAAVVKALYHLKDQLGFNIRAIFQPAEEIGVGAYALINEGVLQDVKYALSLHVDPLVALGKIAIKPGPINAAVVEFEARFKGKAAHVARIHQGIDTILPAVRFISDSYSFVPKKIDARDQHILYFGQILSGTASNIVSTDARLLGTIRAFKSEVAETVYNEVRNIGMNISQMTGAAFDLTQTINLKAVVNNPRVASLLELAATLVVGEGNIVKDLPTSMGGEDFGAIMEKVPGAMMRVGVAEDMGTAHGLHTPYFDVPESCIGIAANILANAVIEIDRQGF